MLADVVMSINNNFMNPSARPSIWQLIALIISLCLSIAGGLAYQANVIDKRLEQLERGIDLSEKNMTARFEGFKQEFEKRINQSEKNITARFEDLKQEVRTQRK
jgi:F0F1-type ATP synthase membrane subunit b/b'